MSPIALALRSARERAGLTQAQLAAKLRVTQAQVSKLESGRYRSVDLELLDRMCSILDVEPAQLLARTRVRR